jgi:TetR/AcrR family transcriptional regulator, mexCD-oprJ operon repressor
MAKPPAKTTKPAAKRRAAQPRNRADARRNRAAMLDAARVVLAKDPDASYAEIARRAQVNQTTLYRHFPSRKELLKALVAAGSISLDQATGAVDLTSGSARDAIRRVTVAWLHNARHWWIVRYTYVSADLQNPAANAFKARITPIFERGQHDGSIRTDLPPETLRLAWSGLVLSWIGFHLELDPEPMADTITQTICGPPPNP